MTILYLHGASMTEKSFTRFQNNINRNGYCPEYEVEDGLEENIEWIYEDAVKHFKGKPVDIVAHSMGGLIAVALLQKGLPIRRIATMSTPFGGSPTAEKMKWFFPGKRLFSDVSLSNRLIQSISAYEVKTPMFSIVTIAGGTPLKNEPNDGVVTIRSQKALTGPTYKEYETNHFEILQCDDAINDIKYFIRTGKIKC